MNFMLASTSYPELSVGRLYNLIRKLDIKGYDYMMSFSWMDFVDRHHTERGRAQ
jgi:hypothetical protein